VPAAPNNITGITNGLCNAGGVNYFIPAVFNATSYTWSCNVGTIVSGAGSNSIVVNFANFSTGTITVKAINACGQSLTRTLNLSGRPAVSSLIANTTNLICTNSSSNYSVNTVTGATNYLWVISAGGMVSAGQGSKNVTVQWLGTAFANQSISVSTSNNCGSSPIRTFSGITMYNCAKNSDPLSMHLNVYPNPAKTMVNVQFNVIKESDFTIYLYDNIGRTIYVKDGHVQAGIQVENIQLDHLSKGIYFVSVEMENQKQQIILMVD